MRTVSCYAKYIYYSYLVGVEYTYLFAVEGHHGKIVSLTERCSNTDTYRRYIFGAAYGYIICIDISHEFITADSDSVFRYTELLCNIF